MKAKPRRRPAMTHDEYHAVMDRAQGRCEAQVAPGCTRRPEEWHHRQSRSVGGHNAGNGIGVCHACHAHIHAHPAASREAGLIVSRHHPAPVEVPVMRRGELVMLDDHGGWKQVRA